VGRVRSTLNRYAGEEGTSVQDQTQYVVKTGDWDLSLPSVQKLQKALHAKAKLKSVESRMRRSGLSVVCQ